MAATRRLTTILAADVAGYSRLMGADEEGTLEHLKWRRYCRISRTALNAAQLLSQLVIRPGCSMRSKAYRPGSISDLRIERVSIERLKLDPRNPRAHSDRQIKQIARSIKAFGFNVPVLADQDGDLLAGHGRVHAARRLGLREIPVIRLEHLTPDQARAFSIADNRLSETSSWDERLLGEVFRDLASVELDFDLEATGFTMGEIDLRIEGLSYRRLRRRRGPPAELLIDSSTPKRVVVPNRGEGGAGSGDRALQTLHPSSVGLHHDAMSPSGHTKP